MNAFAKVPFGKVFTISNSAFWRKLCVETEGKEEVYKTWDNEPIPTIECFFVGTRTIYKGRFTNNPTRWPQNQLADRTPLAGAMFQPVDSNKWRKPIMVILEPCPGCKKPASTVGEGTGYLCETCQKRLSDKIGHAEFVLEQFGPTCRFCGAVACKLENGNVQCHACGSLDDEPGYHDDSGSFPEPIESKPWENFDINDVAKTHDEAYEYGYVTRYYQMPYRPIDDGNWDGLIGAFMEGYAQAADDLRMNT